MLQTSSPRGRRGSAFTLLEVILAMAILAGSVTVLSEVLRLADRNAASTQAGTQAQLIANSLLDEMASGLTEISEIDSEPIETQSPTPWIYHVTVNPVQVDSSVTDLLSVEVLVEQDLPDAFRPIRYRLQRWFYQPPEEATQDLTGDSSDSTQSRTPLPHPKKSHVG